tara:strand:- start:62 stop:913 length:852 start_codon:yes stop_codon:yes gene_type:complete
MGHHFNQIVVNVLSIFIIANVKNLKVLDLSQKIIIKVGSSLLTNTNGGVRKSILSNIVKDIAWLVKNKKQIIIVSSGAIAIGRGKLSISKNLSLNESQAVAARGQIELMTSWQNEFKKHKIHVAQILLSPQDTLNRKSSKNAQNTINTLWDLNCVPIINENDTTSTDEIKFGDNDILAAKIAKLIKAESLILLSNVDGLYESSPKDKLESNLIKDVKVISKKIKDMAGVASKHGKGGMISKIEAAEICTKSKCSVIITSGLKDAPIKNLMNKNNKSTYFHPKK